MKVRIVGKGRRKTIRLTATRDGDSRTLLALVEALAKPADAPTTKKEAP